MMLGLTLSDPRPHCSKVSSGTEALYPPPLVHSSPNSSKEERVIQKGKSLMDIALEKAQ